MRSIIRYTLYMPQNEMNASHIHTFLHRYAVCFTDKKYVASLILALCMLAAGLVANAYAVSYATDSASAPVTDLVLSNVRVYDVDSLFVNGAIALGIFIIGVCLWDPARLPFVVKSIAIFVITRSIFIMVTHIGAFPTHAIINPDSQNLIRDVIGARLYSSFFLGNDSFFSGHTGLPFLMALLYWDRRWLRMIFIAVSAVFAAVVLLGHLHYTIDVLSAFFIAYGVYRISRKLFAEDEAFLRASGAGRL